MKVGDPYVGKDGQWYYYTRKDIMNTPFKAACGVKRRWDADDVIAEYDSNLNITLARLSQISLWDIEELKDLLLRG